MNPDDGKSLAQIKPKYHCMATGQKRMTPCAGCTNTKGCMTSAMQYKETETTMDEKAVLKVNMDGEVASCAKGDLSQCGYKGGKVCGKCGAMAVQVKNDDTDADEKGAVRSMPPVLDDQDETEAYEGMADDDIVDEAADEMAAKRRMARKRRIESMGMKSDDVDDDAYVCAFERKMLPGNGSPCASCPGGCAPEKGMPTILEIEGIAEEMFGGKVLDSGYGDACDLFLVDMERKDGKVIEIVFHGITGECEGWNLLNVDAIGYKSADQVDIIGMDDAAAIAVKSLDGEVQLVEADDFDGIEAWAVEINGTDGKAYDVYVGLDGKVLGYDVYEAEEVVDIDAEAAEILLKRAYSEADRSRMAEEGEAMEDGSFPIANVDDLKNAIQAFGRAADKDKAKAHIMKRAEELDAIEMIPDHWREKPTTADDPDDGEKSAESDEFLASLMEFELLAVETDLDN